MSIIDSAFMYDRFMSKAETDNLYGTAITATWVYILLKENRLYRL